ncbi:MAG TPA: SRPBCC domain-containing protein [Candidatus Angelobacter sp.]|nr:SRPBCC domain-containing protein [Candidatus Angelobacter sp.]
MPAIKERNSAATKPAQHELVITRLFDAPRDLVFAAWTEQKHLDRWQNAPEGFTVTVEESNIQTGGAYRICMRSPEGVEHWLQGVYREVVRPERLVFTHAWVGADGKPADETLVTITFTERDGKTELTLRQTGFKSVESRNGHSLGWNSTFDRLTNYLSEAK